jgi:hypothetical protein
MTCARYASPYTASSGCFNFVDVKVPLKYFFPNLEKETVITNEKADHYTRWLNNRARLLTDLGTEPVDTKEPPTRVVWTQD